MKTSFRAVLRIRLPTRTDLVEPFEFDVGFKTVKFTAPDFGFMDSEPVWASMSASGFDSEGEAIEFGCLLAESCEVSAIAHRFGVAIDSSGPAAPGFFIDGTREIFDGTYYIRGIYPGLDVYEERANLKFITNITNAGFVKLDVAPFIAGIKDHFSAHSAPVIVGSAQEPLLRLLNEALQIDEPVGRTVLLISIIESLGQDEVWSQNQKRLIKSLYNQVAATLPSELASKDEILEVSAALQKMHRLSLRQGVIRLLRKHSLDHFKKPWDRLYDERSKIVQANSPGARERHYAMAIDATNLCGLILIKIFGDKVRSATSDITRWYPVDESLSEFVLGIYCAESGACRSCTSA